MYITEALPAYSKEAKSYVRVSAYELKQLHKQYKNGDQNAKRLMFENFARLSFKIAHQFKWMNYPAADMVQEANLHVCEAIEKWTEAFPNFEQYVAYEVLNGLYRYVDRIEPLNRIPHSMKKKLRDIYIDTDLAEKKGIDYVVTDYYHTAFHQYHSHGVQSLENYDEEQPENDYNEWNSTLVSKSIPHLDTELQILMEMIIDGKQRQEICEYFGWTTGKFGGKRTKAFKKIREIIKNKLNLPKFCDIY